MTIDERLDKLTARHEALTQTVEIIGSMQLRNEEAIKAMVANVDRLNITMDRLANIVIRHEERLDDLDGGK